MASLMSSFNWLGMNISFDFDYDSITTLVEFSSFCANLGSDFAPKWLILFPVSVMILFIMKVICLSFSLTLAASIFMLFARKMTYSSRGVEPVIITIITPELVLEAELCRDDERIELPLE